MEAQYIDILTTVNTKCCVSSDIAFIEFCTSFQQQNLLDCLGKDANLVFRLTIAGEFIAASSFDAPQDVGSRDWLPITSPSHCRPPQAALENPPRGWLRPAGDADERSLAVSRWPKK